MKFKVGDKVVCTLEKATLRVGIIRFIDDNGDCAIRFDPKDNPKMRPLVPVTTVETEFGLGCFYNLYKKEPVVRVEIVANPETRKTKAAYLEDGKIKAEAEAKCCPEDKWDANIGAQLALRRLMGKVDAKIMINAEGVIKGLLGMEE